MEQASQPAAIKEVFAIEIYQERPTHPNALKSHSALSKIAEGAIKYSSYGEAAAEMPTVLKLAQTGALHNNIVKLCPVIIGKAVYGNIVKLFQLESGESAQEGSPI